MYLLKIKFLHFSAIIICEHFKKQQIVKRPGHCKKFLKIHLDGNVQFLKRGNVHRKCKAYGSPTVTLAMAQSEY